MNEIITLKQLPCGSMFKIKSSNVVFKKCSYSHVNTRKCSCSYQVKETVNSYKKWVTKYTDIPDIEVITFLIYDPSKQLAINLDQI